MSINTINAASTTSVLSQVQSATDASTDLSSIEQEVKRSGREFTAQQLVDEYDVTMTQAKQILKDLEEGTGDASKLAQAAAMTDIPATPTEEEVPENADETTVSYRV